MKLLPAIGLVLVAGSACSDAKESLDEFFNAIELGEMCAAVADKVDEYCNSWDVKAIARCYVKEGNEVDGYLKEHQRKKCDGDVRSVFIITQLDQSGGNNQTDPIEFYQLIYVGADQAVCDKEAFGLSG